ncbi:MAG: helix-turn-helix transcriptional regulator [Actinomycetota bacterium]|nr:helix-turn-helix transcriptional regulator [Actinomycetota bacterium]
MKDYGERALSHDTEMSRTALRSIVRGTSVPRRENAERIALALGRKLGEIEWPRGFTQTTPDGTTYVVDGEIPEDLAGLIEASAGSTEIDPTEVDVLADPELTRIGARSALRALMQYLGREETDKVYRQNFGIVEDE